MNVFWLGMVAGGGADMALPCWLSLIQRDLATPLQAAPDAH